MISRLHSAPTAFQRPTPVGRVGPKSVVVAAVDVAGPPATSRRVLQVAASLRGPGGERPELHVVYAWTMVGASILACQVRGVSPPCMRDLLSRAGRRHRERVLGLCDEVLPHSPDGLFVRRGDPRTVVPDAAERLGADLVVVGGPSNSGLGRLLLGSVGRAVIDRVSCDVLTVRGRHPW